MTKRLLYIEPSNIGTAKPVMDQLTKKIAAAFRAAKPTSFFFRGVHRCICGAKSECHDYILPDTTVTNSLCIHYLAHHRLEIPKSEIERVSRLPFGQCMPTMVEHWGSSSNLRVKTRIETLESKGFQLQVFGEEKKQRDLPDSDRYSKLIFHFTEIPLNAIDPFIAELKKFNLEPQDWIANARTIEGFRAKTFEPMLSLLDHSDSDVQRWAMRFIGQLASAAMTPELSSRTVSKLTSLIHSDKDSVQFSAIRTLKKMGATAKPAISTIFEFLYNDGHDFGVIKALNKIGNWAAVALPVLFEDLKSPREKVRLKAMEHLSYLGNKGGPAIPTLLDLFHNTDEHRVKRALRTAIKEIDPHVGEILRVANINKQPTTTSQVLQATGYTCAQSIFFCSGCNRDVMALPAEGCPICDTPLTQNT